MGSIEVETGAKRQERTSVRRRGQNTGLWFVLPASLFTITFFVVPFIMAVYMSLYNWPMLGPRVFTGVQNYIRLFTDEKFWSGLVFTIKYTLLLIPITLVLAFILALLVNLPLRWVGIFRTAYFLPVVIGMGSSSLLWVWMLNDRVGVINAFLRGLELVDKPIIFLGNYNTALASILVSVVWKIVGFTMVLFLTGMQAIPDDLYQAAMVDGAGFFQRLYYITLPLLRRTIVLALILLVIGGFLGFDPFYIMTRGGPQDQTITTVYWIVNTSFTHSRLGYGAAMSIVLLVILIILNILQLRFLRDETTF